MSRVIILSPYFPPSTVAGVHRARHLAKHLPAAGWAPTILCVDERYHEQRLDPGLASLVPAGTDVVKVAALPVALGRSVGIGEISLRAWRQLSGALDRLIAERRPSVVFITGSPFYPMLLARRIEKRHALPVVLDFQDPWTSLWGAAQPLLGKAGISHRLATVLEPRALRAARFVTSVSETQNAEMAARYPWLDAQRMAAIPIGGDPEDFEHLRAAGAELPADVLDPARTNLSFVGTFMPRSGPLVRLVLGALRRLQQEEPDIGCRLRLNFVGTSNQPNATGRFSVRPIAQELGVAGSVHEIPERLPFLQALAVLARSEGVLLVGSDEPHYTASKIYPALMSGRPFLSLFHPASSAHAILAGAGGGLTHIFSEAGRTERLTGELASSLRTLVIDRGRLGSIDPAAYAPYEARTIAHQFANVFDSVARPT